MSEYLSQTYALARLGTAQSPAEAEENFLRGRAEGLQALRQAVYLLLQTEQGEYEIYPGAYGVRLGDLVGRSLAYAIPEVERRLREALMADERIISVEDFRFERRPGSSALGVSFMIRSVYGELAAQKEVWL